MYIMHTLYKQLDQDLRSRGGILLISSYTLTVLGRVSAKNVNKLTDLNAAVSSPGHYSLAGLGIEVLGLVTDSVPKSIE